MWKDEKQAWSRFSVMQGLPVSAEREVGILAFLIILCVLIIVC